MAPTTHISSSVSAPYKALSVQTSNSSAMEWKRPNMKDKKRQRRGAIMCSTDDSLECVMAAMMHSDLLNSCDDEDRSDESEGGKRRRSSALSSLTSKNSDSSPRGSLTGSETSIFFFKEPAVSVSEASYIFKSKTEPIFGSETKNSFTIESFGESISRNMGDMKQIAPFSLELPIFETIPSLSEVGAVGLDQPCSISTFYTPRR